MSTSRGIFLLHDRDTSTAAHGDVSKKFDEAGYAGFGYVGRRRKQHVEKNLIDVLLGIFLVCL